MNDLILQLPELRLRHEPFFGSKAVNLGVVANKSKTTPGFCLSTKAYFDALYEGGVSKEVIELAESAQHQDIDRINDMADKIQGIISRLSLTPKAEAALRKEYDQLVGNRTGVKLAVRSSATAEDLPSASFAGQLESYLNVGSYPEILEAVIKCWCSLWNPRAIHYRYQRGIAQNNSGMAVIIQEMVAAEVAGVMFTANPLTSSRNELYIEAIKGLGENLVQGKENGDKYLVKKDGLYIPMKETMFDAPLITDFHIRWLADEGMKLESLFGFPQDIEWAYSWGEIFILQTRPITTLKDEEPEPLDEKKMTPIQRDVWTNINERFPEPVLPIDSVIAKTYYLCLFEAYKQLGFSVPYVNWHRVEEGIFPDYFMPPAIKPNLLRIFKVGKMLKLDIEKEWKVNETIFERYLRLLKRDLVKEFPMEIIHEYLEDALKDFQRTNTFRYLLYIQYGVVYKFLHRVLKSLYGSDGTDIFNDIVAGQPQITMELNEKLVELAGKIRENSQARSIVLKYDTLQIPKELLRCTTEGEKILDQFEIFLANYGNRELSQGLGGIAADTWREHPEVVWGMLKGVLDDDENSQTYFLKTGIKERRAKAEQKLKELSSKGFKKLVPIGILNRLIDYARKYTAFREDSHFFLTQAMPVFRMLFLTIGKQLVKRGVLSDEYDVMYFTYWELKELLNDIYNMKKVSTLEIEEMLAYRRKQYQRRKEQWFNREVVTENQGELLRGIGASSGKVSGRCKIILDPKDFYRLQSGDILVAQYTNPSWTPLFSFVGGLVVEYGSAISHSAIIAREYGIPAVMGVKGVTKLLSDNEIITVDGSNGLITKQSMD